MGIIQSIILGITQGITEFLPISSSGHLILIPKIFGWNDPGLSFTIALHWGTLFGVIGYFYKDWLKIFKNAFIYSDNSIDNNQNKILYFIIIATIPGAFAGYFLESKAETIFRNPILVSVTLIVAGIILFISDIMGEKNRQISSITLKSAVLVGLAQAIAIVPGVSRSGITIAAAMFLGLSRKDSAHFSFLLATPIILGAGLVKLPDILNSGVDNIFIAGFLFSAIAGFFSIKWLLKYVQTKNYFIFVIYRIILGMVFLIFI
ncbi:MAG: undecaprenyl-diphosphatase UppP [Parcubacteria group bacterium GW2011_GWA2_38_13b]|nr:MAG: undecaprenyl-diphosphatase UppP [Parcubacteria group bacterium GW2011_GWA2_38_13b]